eukprot:scaffold66944_cov17-Tisochrysis_lutea.AAC.1
MQPDAEGQALQAKECPPKRKFTQSKSLSRLAASSSDQGTVLSKSGVQLENRSASTRSMQMCLQQVHIGIVRIQAPGKS